MIRCSPFSSRGFTLIEVLVSMSLAMIVMAAIFSTYLYLGRNLTRLSYRSVLESQSRKVLNLLTTDIHKAKSVANPTATSLILIMLDGSSVVYDYSADKLTRDPDGPGIAPPVVLNFDIGTTNVQVPVAMLNFKFQYYTTTGGTPTYQSSTTLVPMSIKQIAVSFTLQAGTAAIEGQQGTFTSYSVASGKITLVNRPLPDGS